MPKNCAATIAENTRRRKQLERERKGHANNERSPPVDKPGEESRRKHREDFTRMDKLHMALTELCFALNYCTVIEVWRHGFVPREFFVQHLESRFNRALVGMVMYNPETGDIAKPSELLNSVKVMMSVLQSIENYGACQS